MHLLFLLPAILWAIARVHRSGNYSGIRVYLYALLADAVLAGGYGAMVDYSGEGYRLAYLCGTGVIAIAAILCAFRALKFMRYTLTAFVSTGSTLAALIAWNQGAQEPPALAVIAAGFLIGIAGFLAMAVAWTSEETAFRTLGALWLCQAGMFYIHAVGVGQYQQAWEQIGNWLPAVVLSAGLLKLGFDFKHHAHALVTQS